jgi:CRP-like cAMP-binding protein
MRIFRDLSPKEIKLVSESTVTRTAHRGRIIYTPGETEEALFFVIAGTVHLYRLSREGRKLIVETVGPMGLFGEMPLAGCSMGDLFAEAAEDCMICAMGRADVRRLLLAKPEVALRMLEETSRRLYRARARLGDIAFKGIPARVASLLLRLSQNGSRPIEGTSHQELADMVGVYRETVTSALGKLRAEGILGVKRGRISILNAGKLRDKAEEEMLRTRYAYAH